MFEPNATFTDGTPVGRIETAGHIIDFYRATGERADILFVTFEHRDNLRSPDDRMPWSFKYFRKRGYSVLGVKARATTWYRGDLALVALFESAALRAFLAGFRKVIFYGASMGGTGALLLATPGSTVLVLSPQVSLDPALTPWETRYDEGKALNWSGKLPVDGAKAAAVVYAMYDPYFAPDRRHIDLLNTANLQHLRLPFGGHGMSDMSRETGINDDTVKSIVNDTLTPAHWHRLARRRHAHAGHLAKLKAARPSACVARICLTSELRGLEQKLAQNPWDIPAGVSYVEALAAAGRVDEAIALGEQLERRIAAAQRQLDV